MTTNRFINNPNNDDIGFQREFEKLMTESIQFYGHDIKYLERTLVKEDDLFGEDTISQFNDAVDIEVYIENVDGYDGDKEYIAKFGLEIRDEIVLIMAKVRWEEETGKREPPKAGDLIYIPLTDSLFEIRFVDVDSNFYQINRNYIYRLTCEKFEYSYEDFNTNVNEIDDIEIEFENLDDVSNDPLADNPFFETEGDILQDDNEKSPFGEF